MKWTTYLGRFSVSKFNERWQEAHDDKPHEVQNWGFPSVLSRMHNSCVTLDLARPVKSCPEILMWDPKICAFISPSFIPVPVPISTPLCELIHHSVTL